MVRKTVLITGASSGFGYTLAQSALNAGHNVIATSRNKEKLQELFDDADSGNSLRLSLDVTKRDEVKNAVEIAFETFGSIDVLVNNAGFGMIGAFEEFSEAEVLAQFDANTYGPLWMMQEVLPYMRAQKSGHIINISSVAGFVGYAGSSLYAASKHALEGMSKGLAREVAEFGINVTIINPGPFRTNFAGSSLKLSVKKIEAYSDIHERQQRMKTQLNGNQSGDPAKAASVILKLINMKNPPFNVPLGAMAYQEIPNQLRNTLDEIESVKELGLPTDFSSGASAI